ncbi:NAD-binding protein [Neobacillus cucumis]|uniref:potassium channel family protein n=1 Tax=Neobacillus cucumis TaxID=1740721 RepID=UPI0018E02A9F|nr:potassium channel family protein [Neobacillus cucumis]MBI0578544.1 NAD-binding protein [Neobacillus cucumis]
MGMKLIKFFYYLTMVRGRIFLPFILFYILITSFIAYSLEPKTFESYLTSVYWVLTTLATVGFGDYAPVTNAGKTFTIFLYITGVGLLSLFFGKIFASFRLFEKHKAGGKMKYTGKNHFILIGWSEKTKLAIQEIFKTDKKVDIVVIDHVETAPIMEERLFYVRRDATNEETLKQANLSKAKGVIIFADRSSQETFPKKDPLLVDGKTLLIATAITTMEEKLNKSIHVTAEVINQNHLPLFKQVNVDEFIPTEEMISHAAVRSLFSHGVTHMYSELLSTEAGESVFEISKQAHWKTYRDAFLDLLNKGATLIADGGDLHINQKLDEPIPTDAQLFIICNKQSFTNICKKMPDTF